MPKRINFLDGVSIEKLSSLINDSNISNLEKVNKEVVKIIKAVEKNGDKALVEYTKKFDYFDLYDKGFEVSKDEVKLAWKTCSRKDIDALKFAASRIRNFHERQFPKDSYYQDDLGVYLGYRWTPINKCGIYVPGGIASYPSSVLMNALPAKIAGTSKIIMTVPTPKGALNPLVLVAADIVGVDTIYRLGGAQAVAALAYGTDSVESVDKIVGPGNIWVNAAKKYLFGQVGIDLIAGPSEILVLADKENNPEWIAFDLLSQAEHDKNARSILVTNDIDFSIAVEASIKKIILTMPRKEIAAESWNNNGVIINIQSMDDAAKIINTIAPEHLEIAVSQPEPILSLVTNAGAIFIGNFTPEAIGDYIAGPSHVLPTSGTAKFSSGLSVYDFLKRSSLIRCDKVSLSKVAAPTINLAEAEGLYAHAKSVNLRIKKSA